MGKYVLSLGTSFVIIVACLWAYWPSLSHVPKHDQVSYLASVAEKHSLWSLTVGAGTLNRERGFVVHDATLFRPGLYFLLGVEKYFFGYHFTLWHLTGILLHCVVSIVLFWTLLSVSSGMVAAFASLFFSFLVVNVALVSWENINAYMIFTVFVLLALRSLFLFSKSGGVRTFNVFTAASFMIMAVFFYETGVLFSGLMFFYVRHVAKGLSQKRSAWFMLLPIVFYLLFSLLDFVYIHPLLNNEAGRMTGKILSFETLENFFIGLKWLVFGGIFTRPADVVEISRTVLMPYTLNWQWPFYGFTPHLIRGLAFSGLMVFLLFLSRKTWKSDRQPFFLLLLGMLVVYILLIVVGRVNTRGVITGFFLNTYIFYIFWVILTVLFCSFIDIEKLRALSSWRSLRWLVVILLSGMMFVNVISVRNVNKMIVDSQKKTKFILSYMDRFVEEHKSEPDFSFFLPHSCPGNYPGKWVHKRTDPLWRRYTLGEVFYPEYFDKKHPKYVIRCEERSSSK